jgi:hypothetical protein
VGMRKRRRTTQSVSIQLVRDTNIVRVKAKRKGCIVDACRQLVGYHFFFVRYRRLLLSSLRLRFG